MSDRVAVEGEGATALGWLVRALQLVLAGVTLVGLVRGEWTLVVNGGVSLAVTFLPALVSRNARVSLGAGVTLWITTAVCLHAVGALGPYEWFGWYDSVTHTLSATVVAGAGYASARAVADHHDGLEIPPAFMFVFVLVFVLAFGVLWEVLEFASGGLAALVGGEPVLAQYGARDIVLDLVFNTVGAVLVAVFGTDRLQGVVRGIRRTLAE